MTRRTVLCAWAASVGFLVLWYAAWALTLLYAPQGLLGLLERAENVFLVLAWIALVTTAVTSIIIVYSTMFWAAVAISPKGWVENHGGVLHYLLWKELRDQID